MRFAPKIPAPLPPRLTMDEYLVFVEAAIQECNPALVARQKNLEKRIAKPFRMAPAEDRMPIPAQSKYS